MATDSGHTEYGGTEAPGAKCQGSWRFIGQLRSYQARVLSHVDQLTRDHRLHVVAAPGSGKTILGLEAAGRLGYRTLVLAPSLAIRDQWCDRLVTHFAASSAAIGTSTSLRAPAYLTASTYQSLFAAYTRSTDEDTGESFADADLVALFADVGTIILDEAHHLRTQWHRALTSFIDELHRQRPQLNIIALTATPPYDSSPQEWQRYEALCGPIDAEISVAELIATADLAPHQDYILLNEPSADECNTLLALRAHTRAVIAELAPQAPDMLSRGPLAHVPEQWIDECLDDEVGCVGFLHLCRMWGHTPSPILTTLLANDALEATFEDGFQFIVTHTHLFDADFIQAVTDCLSRRHLLGSNGVINTSALDANRLLLNSVGKLDSIATIAVHEATVCGPGLRMLVLADHIRAETLTQIGGSDPMVKLGVLPAFEVIRRRFDTEADLRSHQRLAVLTGRCVIIPSAIAEALAGLAQQLGCAVDTTVLERCPAYSQARFEGGSKNAVAVMTRALSCGMVTIVVGTAALLGEGWDCPQLNTLVLASTVKATMMTNQMRGRVIRIDPDNRRKVANIWHLATVDVDHILASGASKKPLRDAWDVRKLSRRFDTFVGPHAVKPLVESGVERCASDRRFWEDDKVEALNNDNLVRCTNRQRVWELWHEAIARHDVNAPTGMDLTREVRLVSAAPVQVLMGADYLMALVQMGIWALIAAIVRLGAGFGVEGLGWVLLALGVGSVALLVSHGAKLLLRRRLLHPRHRLVAQSGALVEVLRTMGIIETAGALPRVEYLAASESLTVSLTGASVREQQVFTEAVAELCAPTRAPRYLLVPSGMYRLGQIFLAQNVPSVIATNRAHVDRFVAELAKVGLKMEAVYTRNEEGRSALVTARQMSASNIATIFAGTRRVLSADRLYRNG